MNLAHIFTGLGSDFNTIRDVVRDRKQKQVLKVPHIDTHCTPATSSNSSPASCAQRLREEENERWDLVEGGSPLRFRSCPACSFLSAANESSCEVCGVLVPELNLDSDHQELEANELPAASGSRTEQRKRSLQEVVVRRGSFPSQASDVARHNIVISIFRALDGGQGKLRPEDFQRFAQLLGLGSSWDNHAWAQGYVDLAEEYGWEAMQGAAILDFLRCVNDANSKMHASDEELWAILAHLDRQEGVSSAGSHTCAALALGNAPLQLNLEAQRAPLEINLDAYRQVLERHNNDSDHSQCESDSDGDDCSEGSEDSEESEESGNETEHSERECAHGSGYVTLDEAPPPGTWVAVLYDDDLWYLAQITTACGSKTMVVYENGESEELDLTANTACLAEQITGVEPSAIHDACGSNREDIAEPLLDQASHIHDTHSESGNADGNELCIESGSDADSIVGLQGSDDDSSSDDGVQGCRVVAKAKAVS